MIAPVLHMCKGEGAFYSRQERLPYYSPRMAMADVADAHDHEDQTAETGDGLGRVFGLKIRIGRSKTNAHVDNSGDEEKNGDGG